jgi:hypothetical protein
MICLEIPWIYIKKNLTNKFILVDLRSQTSVTCLSIVYSDLMHQEINLLKNNSKVLFRVCTILCRGPADYFKKHFFPAIIRTMGGINGNGVGLMLIRPISIYRTIEQIINLKTIKKN